MNLRRRRVWVAVLALVAVCGGVARASDPVATFSIVGYDPETGDLGVAVQSKFFAVGAVVPWAEAGVGAVATQAFANTTYGPRGLELLAAGHAPEEVVRLLTEEDPGASQRQLGIVDGNGRVAAFTGPDCMAWAGHEMGTVATAQGNILTGAAVVTAMMQAFEETGGRFGDRLLRALEAGQAAGGDSRGMQSAAILIVREGGGYAGYNDRYCDLRVDDHVDPIGELRRLFDSWSWHALINDGYTACEAEEWTRAFEVAAEIVALQPDLGESYYHPACYYSKAGRREDALSRLTEAVRRDPSLGPRARLDTDFAPLYEDPDFLAIIGER